MDIVKLKATVAQSVPENVLTPIDLPTIVIQHGTTILPAANAISVTESGYYLVTFEALIIGTAQHQLFLLGNGITPTGTEVLDFPGTAGGVCHGRALIMKADSRAFLRLSALHNSATGPRDYLCTLSVSKLASA
jgi:hypothetical protein